MKNGNNNILTSPWLRSFLFLLLLYFSQVYPFYHLHHFHQEGFWDYEISSHPIEVDVEHSSDHHHDEDTQQTKDHQHTYDKYIDWHLIRSQNIRTLTFDDQFILSSSAFIFTNDNNISYIVYSSPPNIYKYDSSSLIIRGPPVLG